MIIKKQSKIYSGKAKSLYETNNAELAILEFRNDATAFNGIKKASLEKKGLINNQINAFVMRYLEQHHIKTQFIDLFSPTESVVRKLHMLPVECVVRNITAGNLCKRLGIEEGKELNPPLFEFYLKNDVLNDPMINESHILSFGWATAAEIQFMKAQSFKINDLLKQLFAKAGILLVDFKLEFGRNNNELLLGDEFSPDGCRLWDAKTHEILDKDRFRKDMGEVIEHYTEVANRLGVQLQEVIA